MTLLSLINLVFNLLYLAIMARIILSFIIQLLGGRPHPLILTLADLSMRITEPLLAPIRRVLPTFGMLDFSPMAALLLLWVIRLVLVRALS